MYRLCHHPRVDFGKASPADQNIPCKKWVWFECLVYSPRHVYGCYFFGIQYLETIRLFKLRGEHFDGYTGYVYNTLFLWNWIKVSNLKSHTDCFYVCWVLYFYVQIVFLSRWLYIIQKMAYQLHSSFTA